jgi:ferric-dicitrate binding protein FerR (iron transport regulator)
VAVVAGVALWWSVRPASPAWNVEWLDGAKRPGRLAVGQRIVTGAGERARIEVADIGEVTLEPRSRARLVRSSAEERRMALERGTLHALIVAPPRQFQVETPAVTAVDLGCAYTLEVADDGRSVVTVETGWVSFERDGRETFVPAGARCVTKPGEEPGLPHYLDAAPTLIAALDRATVDRTALDAALAAARPADALTLWHALARTEGESRAAVYDRLAALAPPPAGVTREGVLRADPAMLDRWWNALGLGDVEWWRLWAQDPPVRPS